MSNATATRKPNAYAGRCRDCGKPVAAKAGLLADKHNGQWRIVHIECPVHDSERAAESARILNASARTRRNNSGSQPACDNGHRTYRADCFCCTHQIGL